MLFDFHGAEVGHVRLYVPPGAMAVRGSKREKAAPEWFA